MATDGKLSPLANSKMPLLTEYIQDFGRFQQNARLYLMNSALSGVTIGIILVLYNLYLTSLGYGADFIGFVLFIGTIGAALTIFPAGICVDRFGGKFVLIWSSVLIGIAGAGQFIFRQPVPLLMSSFVAGAAAAFMLVVNAPFLTLNSTPSERSLLFSFNIVLTLVTTVLGEIVGGALPIWFRTIPWLMAPLPSWLVGTLVSQPGPRSYQLALLAAGVIAAPSFIPLLLMSDDRPLAPIKPSTPLQLKRRVRTTLANLDRARLKMTLLSPIFVLVIVQTIIGIGAGLFMPYFNIYFVQHLGASSALFGIIDGGANTLNALLTLVAPLLVIRIGKVNTIAFTRLLSIPMLLLIGLTSFLPLVATLYLFRQGMMDMTLGILQMFSMEAVPRRFRGLSNSSFQASFQVAWALSAPLGGLIIAHIGFSPVFILGACCYVVAIVLFWMRFRGFEDDSSKKQEISAASR